MALSPSFHPSLRLSESGRISVMERLARLRKRLARTRKAVKHHLIAARRNRAKAKRLRARISAIRRGPNAAARWALKQVGAHEVPAGSNRGPKITPWQEHFGEWLVGEPWCGVFVGMAIERAEGDVTSRVASVALIEDDARGGTNGFSEWLTTHAAARRGDCVVLFGRGVHVGLVLDVDLKAGVVHTVEGNTSAGTVGSQDNGGGVYTRSRPFTAVRGYARPTY